MMRRDFQVRKEMKREVWGKRRMCWGEIDIDVKVMVNR